MRSLSCTDQDHIGEVAIEVGVGPPTLMKVADVLVALKMGHAFYTESQANEVPMSVEGWVCGTCHHNTVHAIPGRVSDDSLPSRSGEPSGLLVGEA